MSAGQSAHHPPQEQIEPRSPLPRRGVLPRRLLIGAAALTSALAMSIPAAQAAQSAPQAAVPKPLVQVSAAAKLPSGARVIGSVASTAKQSGSVALRLSHPAAATAFVDGVSNPKSAYYHHYLAKGQFTKLFGPSSSAVAAVESELKAAGLTVSGVSANRLLINFKGTAADVQAAFHTGLRRVQLTSGKIGQYTTTAVRLPGSIAHYVQAVVGLDQLVKETNGLALSTKDGHAATAKAAKPATSDGGPVACGGLASSLAGYSYITDQQVAQAYGLDSLYASGDLGKGQTIDVYELEPFDISDIATFDKCYFGTSHTSQITVTEVDGGPGTGPGSAEAALDVEDVSAIAPGAKIHVFEGPNMDDPFGPLDTWNAIAVADDANQVTSSWGQCETDLQQGAPGVLQVENEIFEQTAAQGQTVFAAAGDDGSDSCASHASTATPANLSVLDPASQPYVTSVGGTTMTDVSEPPAETVWNNGTTGGAGGGGISEVWPMQPWQTSAAVAQTSADEACSNDPSGNADAFHLQGVATTLPAGTTCRETPDVSGLADPQSGITIYYDGFWTPIGGTSSSTPLWAAMLAEINASSSCSSLTNGVGFADPLLYQVASSSSADYADAFNDITVGNNDNLNVTYNGSVDWPAAKGYDLASGLGTPRVTNANGAPGLDAQLCTAAAGTSAVPRPQVTGLSPDSGSVQGEGTVTINGSNFGSTPGSVFFGNVSASVDVWTSTSITVFTPAFYTPDGTASTVGGRADVTVVTAGSQHLSSALDADSVFDYVSPTLGPTVDYVSSSNGPTAGGNTVHIVGSGFTGATGVSFGDVAATSFSVSSQGNEISVKVPASDGKCAVSSSQGICAVAVTVTTPAGSSSGPAILPAYEGPIEYQPNGDFVPPANCGCEIVPAPQEYDYAPAPHITSVSPAYASENGTSVDVITGSGFNLDTFQWVNVGTAGVNFSENFNLAGITPTQITFDVPPVSPTTEPGPMPLSVKSGQQLSNVSSITYAGTPELTSISRHLAAQADPGSLTIDGEGLSDVSYVEFQVQGSLNFLYTISTTISDQTDTSLKVVIPSGYIFPSDVEVCSVSGCSAPDPKVDTLQLAYAGQPVLTSSSPASGPAHGGTLVTIQGQLDSEVTAIDFGSTPATTVELAPESGPSGEIIVAAPPGKAGTKVDITITTNGGTLVGKPRSAVNNAVTFTYVTSTPAAPTDVAAKAAVKSAVVSWAAPADNGGSAITGYQITATAKGQKSVVVKVSASTTKTVVSKLAAGVSWTLTVQAVNKLGAGLPASSKPVTPSS